MQTILFRCPPGGQFHFGHIALDDKTSLDSTTPIYHSDTLASALVATAYRAFPKTLADKMLGWFKNGEVRFSSLFFCLENRVGNEANRVFFLPKPVQLDAGNYAEPKKVRKVMFVSKGIWEAGLTPEDWGGKQPACRVIQKKFVLLKNELDILGCPFPRNYKIFDTGTVPKVKIHQPERGDNLYFHGNVFLSHSATPRAHFFALVKHGLGAEDWGLLFSLLEILADEGIGGERSVGCGKLEGIEDLGAFDLSISEKSERCATLSMVSPADEDDLGKLLAWKTATRGGRFINASDSLKRLKMVAEGALAKDGLTGCHRDLWPNSKPPYLRFGHALNLPLHKKYADYGGF